MNDNQLLELIDERLEMIHADNISNAKQRHLSAAENLLRLANQRSPDFRKNESVVELKKWVTKITSE